MFKFDLCKLPFLKSENMSENKVPRFLKIHSYFAASFFGDFHNHQKEPIYTNFLGG